jgi:hypothetical protein
LAATETAVKQAKLDQYRIVYFATHGLVAGDLESFARDKAEIGRPAEGKTEESRSWVLTRFIWRRSGLSQ